MFVWPKNENWLSYGLHCPGRMGARLRWDHSKIHVFDAFKGQFWAKIKRRHMGGLFGTVLDTTNSTRFGLETFRLTSLMKGRHLLLSIYWLSCSKLESHFTLLIKSVSNFCSNLMKLGPQLDFGLSQAHKKSDSHIWSLRVFFDTLYYKHSSNLSGNWILTKLNTNIQWVVL